MHVPHETGQVYRVKVFNKATRELSLWEGRATNITDAFTQARDSVDPLLVWTEFTCDLVGRD